MLNNKVSREIKNTKKCFRIICYCSTEKDECKLITGMHREPDWIGEVVMKSKKIFWWRWPWTRKQRHCVLCLISQGPTLIPSNHSLAGHEPSSPVTAISFSSLVLALQYFVSTDHQWTSTSLILTLKSNHQCLQGERSCLQSPILKQNRETHIYCWWNTEHRNRSQVSQGLPMSSMKTFWTDFWRIQSFLVQGTVSIFFAPPHWHRHCRLAFTFYRAKQGKAGSLVYRSRTCFI